jgi:hypothetical protein
LEKIGLARSAAVSRISSARNRPALRALGRKEPTDSLGIGPSSGFSADAFLGEEGVVVEAVVIVSVPLDDFFPGFSVLRGDRDALEDVIFRSQGRMQQGCAKGVVVAAWLLTHCTERQGQKVAIDIYSDHQTTEQTTLPAK